MMASDGIRLLLLLSIPLGHLIVHQVSLSLLYLTQAGISALSAVFDAAYDACLPNLVTANQLPTANNAMQTAVSLSRMFGPIVGGGAIGIIGSANTILLDVVSYAISIGATCSIRRPFAARTTAVQRRGFWRELREGLLFVWGIRPLRQLMLYGTAVNLVGPGMDVALLYRIQHVLRLPSTWSGIVMAGLSIGMVIGAVTERALRHPTQMMRWLILSAWLQVLPPIVLTRTTNPYIIALVQVGIGILLVAWNVQIVTLRQTLVPDDMRGRALSVSRLCIWVSIPLGDAIAGSISEHWGTSAYFVIAACVLFSMAISTVTTRISLSS